MKYVKMLGLAAVAAMALMAFAGAGTASASVLCKTATNPCTSAYPNGETIEGTLEKETTATLRNTETSIVNTCTGSSVKGSLTNGSSTVTAKGSVTAANLTWSGCSASGTATVTPGELEIHATTNGNGTVTAKGFAVTQIFAGLSCSYTAGTGVDLGTYNEAAKTINVNVVVNKDSNHSAFLCPSTAVWEAKYVITSPAGTVYVSAG
jgi:hypothetical protein